MQLAKLSSSKTIFNIYGINVRITYILIVFISIMILLELPNGLESFFSAAIVYIALVTFVFLHEMGHSLAAIKDGARVRAIYLHPLGGLAQIYGSLPGPGSEIIVAAAGPFVSLTLAAFFYLPLTFIGNGFLPDLLLTFFKINMALALFNFLPIFPLDGGRIMSAILVIKMGSIDAAEPAVKISKFGTIILGIIGVILLISGHSYGISILLIAIFIYFLGNHEMQTIDNILFFASEHAPSSSPKEREGWLTRKINARKKKLREQKKEKEIAEREEVDNILRKVNREGISSLTSKEKYVLNKASQKIK